MTGRVNYDLGVDNLSGRPNSPFLNALHAQLSGYALRQRPGESDIDAVTRSIERRSGLICRGRVDNGYLLQHRTQIPVSHLWQTTLCRKVPGQQCSAPVADLTIYLSVDREV